MIFKAFEPGKLYKRIISAYCPLMNMEGMETTFLEADDIVMYVRLDGYKRHQVLFKDKIYLITERILRTTTYPVE